MYPHQIRLRGPWEIRRLSDKSLGQRVDLPTGWRAAREAFGEVDVHLSRRFGLPRTLDDDDAVWITWHGPVPQGLSVNELKLTPIATSFGAEYEATSKLLSRNELTVDLRVFETCPEVSLEIRGPVFLRDVQWSQQQNGWTGLVVGPVTRKLEIHLLAHGRLVERLAVAADLVGAGFCVPQPAVMPEGPYNPAAPRWRLELIEGANRWHIQDVVQPGDLQ